MLENPTYFEVAEVLPRVMQELELAQILTAEAAVRVALKIAKDVLNSGDDPLEHIRDFWSLWIRSDYTHEISGLGTLYDDVYVARSRGRSDEEIREEVRSILKDFAR